MRLCVPINFHHVVFQVAQCSFFLKNVKEKLVFNYLRRFDNIWMINSTQRIHFAPVDVLFRICTPVQLLLVDFLSTVSNAGRLVPSLEYLIESAIRIVGRLDASDYLIDLGKLHCVPRDDCSFVIRFYTHLFLLGLTLSSLHLLFILDLLYILALFDILVLLNILAFLKILVLFYIERLNGVYCYLIL